MAVPEGLYLLNKINGLHWLTLKSGPNIFQ